MNVWIIKNIKFGYRYTTNKNTRKIILDYFNDYLFNLILTKSKKGDKFIIMGGLFSNTNPSIIAITDAYESLLKLSKIIDIILVSSDRDMRLFDGEIYSTLNLFKNIYNIEIISEIKLLYYNNLTIDVTNTVIKVGENDIVIPNAIQFEKDDTEAGIFINKENGKYTTLKNNYSPKHRLFKINEITDFDNINLDKDFIHLLIDSELLIKNKSLVNINIFKIKPISVKYTDKEEDKTQNNENILDINNNFNILSIINDNIIDDKKLKKQFDRILNIYNKK